MSFSNAREARIYAQMESMRTHKRHIVIPCKQYLCPPKEYFGKDYYPAFAVVLAQK